jgi:hypothetical protein
MQDIWDNIKVEREQKTERVKKSGNILNEA